MGVRSREAAAGSVRVPGEGASRVQHRDGREDGREDHAGQPRVRHASAQGHSPARGGVAVGEASTGYALCEDAVRDQVGFSHEIHPSSSNRKPFAQKGTGRARQGQKRFAILMWL